MFDEAVVDMGNGNLVRVPELSARLAVGEKGPVKLYHIILILLLIGSCRTYCHSQYLECRVFLAFYSGT